MDAEKLHIVFYFCTPPPVGAGGVRCRGARAAWRARRREAASLGARAASCAALQVAAAEGAPPAKNGRSRRGSCSPARSAPYGGRRERGARIDEPTQLGSCVQCVGCLIASIPVLQFVGILTLYSLVQEECNSRFW